MHFLFSDFFALFFNMETHMMITIIIIIIIAVVEVSGTEAELICFVQLRSVIPPSFSLSSSLTVLSLSPPPSLHPSISLHPSLRPPLPPSLCLSYRCGAAVSCVARVRQVFLNTVVDLEEAVVPFQRG